ncbi:MAG: SusC/RagA family TonB-linked outer membrane protein, partial [Bacteroidota bacterium]
MRKKLLFSLLTLILTTAFSYAQITVSGTVTDASGETLPGVSIMVKGTTQGTATDFDGAYEISASQGDVLIFSFIGFATKEVAVTSSTVNVSLAEDTESLDEVVVTALGIKREEKALGYSLTEVKGDEMNQVKTTNAMNALQGRVAGVNVSTNSTGASGSSRVIIRGASSLTGDNQPLYVIDGIPMVNRTKGSVGAYNGEFGDGGDDVGSISPDDIESVSVLKGSSAAALYGSAASNGVIMITTKSGKGTQGLGIEFSSSLTFDKVNTGLQDFQTTYGQGTFGVRPGYERDTDGNVVPITDPELAVDDALVKGLSSWGERFDGAPTIQWDGVKRPYSYSGDNVERFYNVGSTAVNTISLVKGAEDYNYRFSVSNLDNDDVFPNSTLKRQSYSFNAMAKINPKLTSTVTARYIIEKVHNRVGIGDGPGNANFTALMLPSNLNIKDLKPGYDENGEELKFQSSVWFTNPYWVTNKFNNDDKKNRLISSATLKYDITDWLYVTGRAGLDRYDLSRTRVTPYGTAYRPGGRHYQTKQTFDLFDADIMLGVNKDLTDKISTNSVVGANTQKQTFEALSAQGDNYVVI